MVSAADPMLLFPAGTRFAPYSVVRNVTGQPATVSPVLYWMAGGAASSAELPQFSVLPNETRVLDVMAMLAQGGLKNLNGSFNLILNVTGSAAHPLIMVAGSVDQTSNYVFQVKPTAIREGASKSLSYWSTGDGDDTMISLWNAADEAQDLEFTLFFSGGQYKLPVHLEPRVTRMFNVSEIIQNQAPDADGNVIPLTVHEGSAVVSGPKGRNEHILVVFDAGTYNVRKATCGQWCIGCDGITDGWIAPNPFAVAVGDHTTLTFTVEDDLGYQYDATSYSNWSSSAPSVLSVSFGYVTGNAAGTATVTAVDRTDPPYFYGCFSYDPADCPPPVVYPSASSPGTVTPRILLGGCSGTDVTNTTQSAVVGQQIVLCASYTLPSGVTVSSQSWSVPGTTVGGFTVGPGSNTGGTTPTNFNQASTTFYWVVSASSQVVVFTLNLSNGQSPTAQATFSIAGPTAVSVSTQLDQARIIAGPDLSFGNPPSSVGIRFTASASPPSGYSNTFVWVQIINSASAVQYRSSGNKNCTFSGVPGLDGTYPYPNASSNTANDSPAWPLTSIDSEDTFTLNAQMFLMWRPGLTNDIPVPLGSVTWQFFGDAVQNTSTQTWTVQSDSSQSANAFQSGSTFPAWSSVANGNATCH